MQGSYIFSNQYQNCVIPEDARVFKPEWIRYYKELPQTVNYFAFIDPAISLENHADYTALAVVAIDSDGTYYVVHASRHRITPPEIINLCFTVQNQYNCLCIGIEEIAYQKALLYMVDEEMRRRGVIIPVKGVKPGNQVSKEYRIQGLVPRFEWGRCFLKQGLVDLENELSQFPRAAHDDLLDALSSIEQIAVIPEKEKFKDDKPNPGSPEYEGWYIRQLNQNKRPEYTEPDYF